VLGSGHLPMLDYPIPDSIARRNPCPATRRNSPQASWCMWVSRPTGEASSWSGRVRTATTDGTGVNPRRRSALPAGPRPSSYCPGRLLHAAASRGDGKRGPVARKRHRAARVQLGGRRHSVRRGTTRRLDRQFPSIWRPWPGNRRRLARSAQVGPHSPGPRGPVVARALPHQT